MNEEQTQKRAIYLAVLAGLCENTDKTIANTADSLRIKLLSGNTNLNETQLANLLEKIDIGKLEQLDGGPQAIALLKTHNTEP